MVISVSSWDVSRKRNADLDILFLSYQLHKRIEIFDQKKVQGFFFN